MSIRLDRSCVAVLLAILSLPGASRAQDYYDSHDKIVRNSVLLFDYPQPVRIRVTNGFGTVESLQPSVPAVICADSIRPAGTLDCFVAQTKKDVFFDDPHTEFVGWTPGHQAVIFEADWNYSGSGSDLLWALLVLNHDGTWKNLLPEVTSSNQSDHLFWHSAKFSEHGIFSLADYIWGKGEDHYGAHRYTIQTYEYCAKSGKYALADEFTTSKKFEPLDAPQPYVVVRPMLPEIQRRLSRKPLAACQ